MTAALDAVRRGQFPALADKTFLDAACASLAPQAAADAIAALLRDVQTYPERSATAFHIRLDAARDATRPAAARLIGARPADIALIENTSHGLAIAAAAIPFEPGDNILVPELEYLQVPLPWRQQPPPGAPEIRLVSHDGGTLPVGRFAAAADSRTRAVVMSSVQWSNGFRADLDAIGAFCRERGMWFVVDGIQQLGAFPIDVGRTPIDILVTGGHKWLNAPFGAGFMYINPASRDRLRPPVAGYLSVDPPEGGWAEYFRTPAISPLQPVTFTPDARRYETGGTGNYPGMVGLAASLGLINSLGPGGDRQPHPRPHRPAAGRAVAAAGPHRHAARSVMPVGHRDVQPRATWRGRPRSSSGCSMRASWCRTATRPVSAACACPATSSIRRTMWRACWTWRARGSPLPSSSSVTRSFQPRAQWSGASRRDSSSGYARKL